MLCNSLPSMSGVVCTRCVKICLQCIIEAQYTVRQNIVLSGGSTMFQHFGQRLKRDIKQIVDRRLDASVLASGSHVKVSAAMLCVLKTPTENLA